MTEHVHVVGSTRGLGRLELLDYLRFGAAAAVLCYHYFTMGIVGGQLAHIEPSSFAHVAKYGYMGVELFFLISGFVIFASVHGKSARRFAVGRGVRLYPAFWFAVLLTSLVTIVWGDVAGLSVTPKQAVLNLTMTPGLFNVDMVDGVYWTLLLELYFYLAVLVLLLLGLGPRLGALLPWWIFGQLGIALLADQYSAVPYLGDSFVLFALGALIAEIRRTGVSPLRALAFAVGVYLACAWTLEANAGTSVGNGYSYSSVTVLILMLGFIALLASTWSTSASNVRLPRAMTVGALTYPLYLVHAHVGYIALAAAAAVMPVWTAYTLVIAGVLLIAYAIHVVVERRPKRFWLRLFDGTAGRVIGLLEWRPKNRAAAAPAPVPGADGI